MGLLSWLREQCLLRNSRDKSWQRGPGRCGEAVAANVEKAQDDEALIPEGNRAVGSFTSLPSGEQRCWGENGPQI